MPAGVDFVLVFLAAIAAGAVNALAGGGTLITFPMLMAVGVPAGAANRPTPRDLSRVGGRSTGPGGVVMAVGALMGGAAGARRAGRIAPATLRLVVVAA